jgi:hypothetical protein
VQSISIWLAVPATLQTALREAGVTGFIAAGAMRFATLKAPINCFRWMSEGTLSCSHRWLPVRRRCACVPTAVRAGSASAIAGCARAVRQPDRSPHSWKSLAATSRGRWHAGDVSFVVVAERDFCKECGTPLSYRKLNGSVIELLTGAFDRPDRVIPTYQIGVNQARLGHESPQICRAKPPSDHGVLPRLAALSAISIRTIIREPRNHRADCAQTRDNR